VAIVGAPALLRRNASLELGLDNRCYSTSQKGLRGVVADQTVPWSASYSRWAFAVDGPPDAIEKCDFEVDLARN